MIKCIVWDLDETLWKGVLANISADDRCDRCDRCDRYDRYDRCDRCDRYDRCDRSGIPTLALNEKSMQVARLAESRGIFQSIASRNDETAALRQLAWLGLGGFFLYPRITPWIIKSQAITDIATHFNISLDSLAFVDDEPFERYEVSRFLPEVAVYAPDNLAALAADIDAQAAPTSDRRVWMENREARLSAEKAFTGTRADFLRECRMVLTVREATASDMDRVIELAGRTRKFNITPASSYPYNALKDPDKWLFVCELEDRFGQHGVVGAGLFHRLQDTLMIDRFCCSCRVEGRGVAAAFLNGALRMITSRESSLKTVHCCVAKTRGSMALALFKTFGFSVYGKDTDNASMNNDVVDLRLTLPCRDMDVAWIETRFV